MMNVADLLEALEGMDPEAVVMLAHQPSWPMQYHLSKAVEVQPGQGGCDACEYDWASHSGGVDFDPENDEVCGEPAPDEGSPPVVYLGEGDHPSSSPYLPGEAREELGW